MTSRDFIYWLQGFFELSGAETKAIDAPTADLIRRHLAMVFRHEIDPAMGDARERADLAEIHASGKKKAAPKEGDLLEELMKKAMEQSQKKGSPCPFDPPLPQFPRPWQIRPRTGLDGIAMNC